MYENVIQLLSGIEDWEPKGNTGIPVTDEEINEAEAELGLLLCGDYKHFLKELGWLEVYETLFLGLFSGEGRQNEASDFVAATLAFRDEFECKNELTVLYCEDDEWFCLLDHSSSLILKFDPFSKEYIETDKGLSDFLNAYARDLI